MSDTSKVSQLYKRREHHEKKIEFWLTKTKDAEKNLTQHLNQLAAINRKLEKIVGRELFLTTHCIDRYRERIDADATEEHVKQHLITPELLKMVRTLGNGTYPLSTGIQVVVEDNKCITCYPSI